MEKIPEELENDYDDLDNYEYEKEENEKNINAIYLNKLNNLYTSIRENQRIKKDKVLSEPFDETARRTEMDSQVINAFCEVIQKDTKLKFIYGAILIFLLGLQLIALNVVFILYGLNILKYSENIFQLFLVGTLGEIIALVTVIVKYLFKDNITKALDNILEKNKIKH